MSAMKGLNCKQSIQSQHTSIAAVEENLRGKVDLGPGEVADDVQAIAQSRGGAEGPASSAVLGDVLVAGHGQVVQAVHIAPVPRGRKLYTPAVSRAQTHDKSTCDTHHRD